MAKNETYVRKLLERNISPSIQRVMILKHLVENPCHPTADRIFSALRHTVPTLSKATVYNTLNLFAEAGLVRVLAMEEKEARYDIVTEPHGHFKCLSCGRIINFAVDVDHLTTDELRDFQIAQKDVHFYGRCPACIVKPEKT